jgi:hypothetical protein
MKQPIVSLSVSLAKGAGPAPLPIRAVTFEGLNINQALVAVGKP